MLARGHPELNWGPLDLQSNALPLSYTPCWQLSHSILQLFISINLRLPRDKCYIFKIVRPKFLLRPPDLQANALWQLYSPTCYIFVSCLQTMYFPSIHCLSTSIFLFRREIGLMNFILGGTQNLTRDLLICSKILHHWAIYRHRLMLYIQTCILSISRFWV